MLNRRAFIGAGAALAGGLAAAPLKTWAALPQTALKDINPENGFTPEPQRAYLFLDYRHIETGDLEWRSREGVEVPVAGPPEPRIPVHAEMGMVPYGIRLVAQRATKEGPLEFGPSEQTGGAPGSGIVQDGGMYRSWILQSLYPEGQDLGSYSQAEARGMKVITAESDDAYTWRKISEQEIPARGLTGMDGVCFFMDPNGGENARYKCIFNGRLVEGDPRAREYWAQYQQVHPRYRDGRLSENHMYGLWGMTSPDGIRWTMIEQPLLIHKGDTDNTVYWDPWLGKYVLYTRLYWIQRRMVAIAESEDFIHWTPVQPLIWPSLDDPFSFDVYTNCRTCYPGLPSYHLMFPQIYRRFTQTSESRIFTSMEGIHWHEVPGGAVWEPGGEGWEGSYGHPRRNLITLSNDRVGLLISEFQYPHKYPRWPGVLKTKEGFATWPKGRLCALQADDIGEFHTFPLQAMGRELHVNARVALGGELRVGLNGVGERGIQACDPITGDSVSHVVTWNGDSTAGDFGDRQIRLHFKMRAADLFGFEWV